jgi:hypothetical protein
MSVFRKRNLLVGIAILVIVGAGAAIWGVPRFMRRATSVNSQVTAYLLDDRGEVNGLLLASGDQLHFSSQTGAIVGTQIKVGDEVSASGHAGTRSSYGREFRVEQISANGRTIVEADARPPRPREPHEKHGPGERDSRANHPGPPDSRERDEVQSPAVRAEATPTGLNRAPVDDPNAKQTASAPPAPTSSPLPVSPVLPEIFKASGTIRAHLVNGRGDVDGLILSNGEQLRFSPRVGELIVAAEQGASTQVSIEGNGVRNERGTVIRPAQITVGNQTISLGR